MRGKLLGNLSLLFLASCASPSGIKVQTVTVPKIVVQKCIQKEDIPDRPSSLADMPSNPWDQIRILLSKVGDWTKYGNQTNIILQGCVKDGTSQ